MGFTVVKYIVYGSSVSILLTERKCFHSPFPAQVGFAVEFTLSFNNVPVRASCPKALVSSLSKLLALA